jgi:hypothetical protein
MGGPCITINTKLYGHEVPSILRSRARAEHIVVGSQQAGARVFLENFPRRGRSR